jgi:hypothetical protein
MSCVARLVRAAGLGSRAGVAQQVAGCRSGIHMKFLLPIVMLGHVPPVTVTKLTVTVWRRREHV